MEDVCGQPKEDTSPEPFRPILPHQVADGERVASTDLVNDRDGRRWQRVMHAIDQREAASTPVSDDHLGRAETGKGLR